MVHNKNLKEKITATNKTRDFLSDKMFKHYAVKNLNEKMLINCQILS